MDEHREQALARLVAQQSGVVARRQLTEVGIGWDAVDARVRAGRWAVRTPRVISTFTGELTTVQRRWLGVLHAGPGSMLGGLTAASHHGLVGWERELVMVLVDDDRGLEPVDGVRFSRCRRRFEPLVSARPGIPTARVEPALLLWAAYAPPLRTGVGVLAAAVQQRLTTAERLEEWLVQLRPLRRAAVFRSVLADIAGGAHSAAELDVSRMCRVFDLPLPTRQVPRLDRSGRRRWTDCEWVLPDGTVLVLEVDGSFHMEAREWGEDLRRGRALTSRERVVLRCTAYELRHEPATVAMDLRGLGLRELRGQRESWV